MNVHSTKNYSFMLYLDKKDFVEFDINPDSISAEQAIKILSKVCPSFHVDCFTKAHIELFPGNNELLMFIKTNMSKPLLFSFSNIEALISAVQNISDDTASSLLFSDGEYILAVWPWDNAYSELAEFGEQLPPSPNYFLHIFEQYKKLIPNNAVSELKKFFICNK